MPHPPGNYNNRTVHIRHQWKKATVLSCHRCLINTGVEKMKDLKIGKFCG
jgi:hypothetical protein